MESHLESNKYYVPEISEFHVGFEYEKYDERVAIYSNYPKESTTTNWHRFKYDLKSIRLSQLGTHLYDKTIRVKYLDQSDIESLGWIKHAINKNCYYIELHKNTFGTIYMEYYDEQETKWCIESDRHGESIFIGTIKNKSELIKLMQQLNIK